MRRKHLIICMALISALSLSACKANTATENTSDDTLSFYPDQSTMVTNKKQLEADFLFSASIGGDFYGNVEKEGLVYFIYEEDLRDVDKMRLFVKGAVDNDFNKVGEDIELELKFK